MKKQSLLILNTEKLDRTHLAVKLLIQYHEIEEEFEEDPDDFDLDELFNKDTEYIGDNVSTSNKQKL